MLVADSEHSVPSIEHCGVSSKKLIPKGEDPTMHAWVRLRCADPVSLSAETGSHSLV